MKVTILGIIVILLISAAIDRQLAGMLKLGKMHYVASIIGPITLQLVVGNTRLETLEVIHFRFSILVIMIFMAFGYLVGWIEIGLFHIVKSIAGSRCNKRSPPKNNFLGTT